MRCVVLAVSNGRQKSDSAIHAQPSKGEGPFDCLAAFRGAVLLTGCRIRSAKVIDQGNGKEWIASPDLLAALNNAVTNIPRPTASNRLRRRSKTLPWRFWHHLQYDRSCSSRRMRLAAIVAMVFTVVGLVLPAQAELRWSLAMTVMKTCRPTHLSRSIRRASVSRPLIA
jgi:hypothetical protein